MTFPFRACVFNAFPVSVLPGVAWRLALVVRGGGDCRAAFWSPLSCKTSHLHCVYADVFFVFNKVDKIQLQHTWGLGLIESCCTLSVTTWGTRPMSLSWSVFQPQILPCSPLNSWLHSSQVLLAKPALSWQNSDFSDAAHHRLSDCYWDPVHCDCMVLACLEHLDQQRLQRQSIPCKIWIRDKPCNYSTSWVGLERKHKALNSTQN